MIQLQVFNRNLVSPTLERIFAPNEYENLRFSTRLPGGFYRCSFDLRMDLLKAWEWVIGKDFYRVLITDGAQTLWEGRIEDKELTPGRVSITAYGYYANLGDIPYEIAYNDLWSTVLGTVITARALQISTQHFTASDRTANSAAGVDWQDLTPMEMIEKFLPLSSSDNAQWDFAVWENRHAWLTKRNPTALNYTCRLADFRTFRLKYTGKDLTTAVYARYQAGGALTRTAWAENVTSQAKYGLNRGYAIPDMGTVAAQEAQTARDAWLAKHQELWPAFSSSPVLGKWIQDTKGIRTPSSWVRAGKVIRILDLVPASGLLSSVSLNRQQTFYVVETEYDCATEQLTLTFDRDAKTLAALLAKRI